MSDAEPGIAPPITCDSCRACCCKLEVILMGDDDPPGRLTALDRWGGSVMRRLDDGWCVALDRQTFLCTIYQRRPDVCREYQAGDADCLIERAKLPLRSAPTPAKKI